MRDEFRNIPLRRVSATLAGGRIPVPNAQVKFRDVASDVTGIGENSCERRRDCGNLRRRRFRTVRLGQGTHRARPRDSIGRRRRCGGFERRIGASPSAYAMACGKARSPRANRHPGFASKLDDADLPARRGCGREGDASASWRSGYAADCKSVYTGSIPVLASMRGN